MKQNKESIEERIIKAYINCDYEKARKLEIDYFSKQEEKKQETRDYENYLRSIPSVWDYEELR